ncbi:MAG TPA: SRPBCC family protein [Promicromonospora sp.]|nr:SRPBCC family protein [Promicromonospora sp.]
MPSYHVTASSTASPDTVWSLLVDGRSWPRWASGLDELVEDRSTGLGPDGHDDVGTVRAFRSGRTVASERVTELSGPPTFRLAYQDVVNAALRDYRAVVALTPGSGGGTDIDWHGTWRARPGAGWLMPFLLPGIMQRMADDLAAYAAAVPPGR